VPNVVMGFAMGLIFVPLTTLTMGGLPNEQMGNAAGIFNLMRNLGGSIGISAVTTLLSRGEQIHQSVISGRLNPYNPPFQQYVLKLHSLFALSGTPDFSNQKTYQTLYNLVLQQATYLSYIDNFRLLACVCVLCLPAVFLLRRRRARSGPIAAH
jgi:MFS transporter, DHA2 family, multidrug resistance protein